MQHEPKVVLISQRKDLASSLSTTFKEFKVSFKHLTTTNELSSDAESIDWLIYDAVGERESFEETFERITFFNAENYAVLGHFNHQHQLQYDNKKLLFIPFQLLPDDILSLTELIQESRSQRVFTHVFPIKNVGRIELLPVQDVLWIKGAGNYVEVYTEDDKYLHRTTLHTLVKQLDTTKFARIHRSTIVNLLKIKELSSELGRFTLVQLTDGTELKIGHAYRNNLFEQLGVSASL
ncbi:LytR/AlgR family response regulator transcription factor [Idiomarina ramblicola]|uniref:LytR/AlgR family response regulator transcription factor n=1 Tax=Idiomarina ramblicola TaxID=263724 RepID=UPI00130045E7|nr:LytTR family DNA-binding domain-containing protein [Idiomarina ramblicola]